MKVVFKILLSVFFAIAIGVHIYYVIKPDTQPFWWHLLYYITYGVCWWMLFSKNEYRRAVYVMMALFPFVTHLYYGYQHFPSLDAMFWICLLVCVLLPAGYFLINEKATEETMAL